MNLENKWLGNEVIYLKSCSSTNQYALDILTASQKSGLMVISEEQTKGRGRFNREWVSHPNESLTFSIIFKKNDRISIPFYTLIPCVALVEVLNQFYQIQAQIKWPNDVLIGDKKISGILAECKKVEMTEYIIVGMGMNVNHVMNTSKAISLSESLGQKINRDELLKYILEKWEMLMDKHALDSDHVRKLWNQYANIGGKELKIDWQGKISNFKAIELNEQGFLKVMKNDEEIILHSGELLNE